MVSLGGPATGEAEIEAVSDLLADGHLSEGDVVAEFEAAIAEFSGRAGGVAVCSGSVAIELALRASGIPQGAGVIVPAYNCGAVLHSVLRANHVPVFADVNPNTGNVRPAAVRKAIQTAPVQVEGLLLTHLYGLPAEIDAVEAIASENDLFVVNDVAQAPGARTAGRRIENAGHAVICSFGATKNLTTAEGGMVLSDDADFVERVRMRRTNGHSDVPAVQYSVRMNDIEAAIGLEQLEKYDEILDRKRRVARIYRERLPADLILQDEPTDGQHVYHGFALRTPDRDVLAATLDDRGVETATAYDTILPAYAAAPERAADEAYPAASRIASEVLLVPIHASMTETDAYTVADGILAALE